MGNDRAAAAAAAREEFDGEILVADEGREVTLG
ncbi:pantothenate kinase type III [Actinomadura rupiterrae]|nr:pantothenate kinase type III [Actinomadura rupiterrae]